ncbi:MAG: hypothetical protein ABIO70_30350 [Pseudomonadota bacterium]
MPRPPPPSPALLAQVPAGCRVPWDCWAAFWPAGEDAEGRPLHRLVWHDPAGDRFLATEPFRFRPRAEKGS